VWFVVALLIIWIRTDSHIAKIAFALVAVVASVMAKAKLALKSLKSCRGWK
jgi:hypothetical protein